MDRRGFLRGVFGGVAAGGLIISAKPEEVEAFAAPLVKNAPIDLIRPQKPLWSPYLYDKHGNKIAIITSITPPTPSRIDVTHFGSKGKTQYLEAMSEVRIEAILLTNNGFMFDDDSFASTAIRVP